MTPPAATASVLAAPPMRIGFDLHDAEDQQWVHGWRSEGCDADTVACCAVTRIYDRVIRQNRALGQHVVITSFQKAASTFLSAALVKATGFRLHLLHATGRDNERNIEIQRVPLFLARNTISQEHLRATEPNIAMLGTMGVKPIVLVRDIFDALVSLRDHWVNEEPVSAIAHVPPGYSHWSESEQLWFCVRVAAPWYFNFYTSWMDRGSEVDALWIRYDEVVNETGPTLQRILQHSGVNVPPDRLTRALAEVDRGAVRFNQGVAGRGQVHMTAAQRNAVAEIAETFGSRYDFSIIGLERFLERISPQKRQHQPIF